MTEQTDFIDNDGLDQFDPEVQKAQERVQREVREGAEQGERAEMQSLRLAYIEVFSPGVTSQDAIDKVMNDIAWFGNGFFTTESGTDSRQKHKEGRRQVWLRVMDFAKLDIDTLFRKYNGAINK
jgi:hypothetical protein